jgi:hypothetical protein
VSVMTMTMTQQKITKVVLLLFSCLSRWFEILRFWDFDWSRMFLLHCLCLDEKAYKKHFKERRRKRKRSGSRAERDKNLTEKIQFGYKVRSFLSFLSVPYKQENLVVVELFCHLTIFVW